MPLVNGLGFATVTVKYTLGLPHPTRMGGGPDVGDWVVIRDPWCQRLYFVLYFVC